MIDLERRCAEWLLAWGLDNGLSADLAVFVGEEMDGATTLEEYQKTAHETAVYSRATALPYLVLGLVGELGEFANKEKKILRGDPGAESDPQEIGDVLWYLAEICTAKGWNLEEIARRNLEKLARRKGAGTLKGTGDTR